MRVSHAHDHITHAVVGGKQAIDFGISDSPEFFHILSSTLYSDQLLAVVREVLCNAWDAHIAAGKQHVPIQISLKDGAFTVRDQGAGIHHDDMGPIYAVYGNSTKKNDGQQTGGFGLGCKAPFAYTDHFTVISAHQGTRTVYNLSKSQAQAMGKPAIIPIISSPTIDTGLTVSVPIRTDQGDEARFKDRIQEIVSQGEMNATLDGSLLPTVPYSQCKEGFLLTPALTPKLKVRYGNVVYPIPEDPAIDELYSKVLHTLRLGSRYYQIVFLAPPHSISVTPSRESLSMQEHTVETLKQLLGAFLQKYRTVYQEEFARQTESVIDQAVAQKDRVNLLSGKRRLPTHAFQKQDVDLSTPVICFKEMARRSLFGRYPDNWTYFLKDYSQRLEKMSQAGLVPRGLAESLRKEIKKNQLRRTDWFHRKVLAPLVVKMLDAGLEPSRLYLHMHSQPYPVRHVQQESLDTVIPFLRNLVILTTRMSDYATRMKLNPVLAKLPYEEHQNLYVYRLTRRKGEKEHVQAFFESQGMQVLVLVPTPERAVLEAAKPRKARATGLPCLSSVMRQGRINFDWYMEEGAERIEDPQFIVDIRLRQDSSRSVLDGFSIQTSYDIITLFGKFGGIVRTDPQAEKWYAQGIADLDSYLAKQLVAYLGPNPRIREYMAYDTVRIAKLAKGTYDFSGKAEDVVQMLLEIPSLVQKYQILRPLTELDQRYMRIYKSMGHRSTDPEFVKLREELDAIPLNPTMEALAKKLRNSRALEFINIRQARAHFRSKDPERLAPLLDFVLNN